MGAFLRNVFTGTATSCLTLSSPPMDTSPCPDPGTRPSGSGICPLERPPKVRGPHEGRDERGLLCRQPADRVWVPRQDHKLWNTLAQCKYTIQEDGHQDWVSCVRFSPNNQNPVTMSPDGSLCASGGKDAKALLWDLNDGKHLYT